MRKILFALSGVAMLAVAAPTGAKEPKVYTCTKYKDGVCVSTHRVRGVAPYKVGYVFGPSYSYSTYSTIPQEVVTYNKLDPSGRYVYTDGYVYVVDPATYAVTRVINTISD